MTPIPYLGEGLAILCAIIWALAVIFFKKSGETIHPLALNVFKNLLALVLFIPTIYLFGDKLFYPAPANAYLLLILSGALGIGIGDTLYFKSLNLLGAGLTSIVVCMYSPFIITLAIVFLGERLSVFQLIGSILIVIAILIATLKITRGKITKRSFLAGIIFGILGTMATASGVVMIKPVLEQSPLIWLTTVRLVGGVIALAIILLFNPTRVKIVKSLFSTPNWLYPIAGAFLGAYVAMAIWLGGMKYTKASIASALNQTSTLFIFIFAGLLLKEPMGIRRIMGIVIAFVGVLLVALA